MKISKRPTKEGLEALAEFVANDGERDATPWELWKEGWRPRLNPTQEIAGKSKARFVLYHGGRGGSKTFGALHKLIEHCFLNDNALGLIIVGIRKQASMGGAWDKLQLEILPIWKNGNKQIANGQWTGKYYDEGIGLPFTEPTSTLDKTQIMWVGNRFGKWSCIALVSMPVDSLVIDRVKGMEPSFVLVDEAQTLESDTYFSAIIQQLGRRPGITTVQQVIYCANPEGPSHWLWKRFWEMPVDPETGEWNEHYARFFFPVEENKGNLPPDYLEINVAEAVRGDKILQQRMLEGIWVDRPSGLAMFADEFRYELCIKPAHKTAAAKGLGIIPNNKYTINFSYDLGQAHTSIDLIQIWPTVEKIWKVNFDEMDYVGQYIPYAVLVPRIIKRMLHWDNFTMADGTKIGPFKFKHISDNSAFNQLRAKDGSFDAWDIEQLSKEYVENNKPLFFQQWIKETGNPSNLTFEQWIEDDKGEYSRKYIIRMLECPKGNHSIEARVRLLKDAMQQEEYMVSATCVYKIQMLQNLEEDPKERLKPKRDRVNIHRFDSATYGLFYYGPGPGRRGLKTAQIEDTGPKFYVCGRNR
jgi:hypothetical protein